MKRLLKKLFHKIVTFINFNVGNKVKPYHLLYNQLQKHRITDMSATLNKRIDSYLLNSNKKWNFIFCRIFFCARNLTVAFPKIYPTYRKLKRQKK